MPLLEFELGFRGSFFRYLMKYIKLLAVKNGVIREGNMNVVSSFCYASVTGHLSSSCFRCDKLPRLEQRKIKQCCLKLRHCGDKMRRLGNDHSLSPSAFLNVSHSLFSPPPFLLPFSMKGISPFLTLELICFPCKSTWAPLQ